jgi:hypothetical protein
MKRHAINLLAVLVITLGGLHLSAQDVRAEVAYVCCMENRGAVCCGANECGWGDDEGNHCWAR